MAKPGQPTKYRVAFCETVIELMKEGASKAECCVELGITPPSFIQYTKDYPEFFKAVKTGEAYSKAWWEKMGRIHTFDKGEGFNSTAYIFNMKNRFGKEDDFGERWSDKQEREITGTLSLTDMSEDELERKLQQLQADEDAE